MVRVSVLLCILVGYGCASTPADRPEIPSRYPLVNPTAAAPPTIIGYSVQGRPIELHTFGAGPRPVLLMAAIHGDEPTTVAIARGLLEELQRNPTLQPVSGPAHQGGPAAP